MPGFRRHFVRLDPPPRSPSNKLPLPPAFRSTRTRSRIESNELPPQPAFRSPRPPTATHGERSAARSGTTFPAPPGPAPRGTKRRLHSDTLTYPAAVDVRRQCHERHEHPRGSISVPPRRYEWASESQRRSGPTLPLTRLPAAGSPDRSARKVMRTSAPELLEPLSSKESDLSLARPHRARIQNQPSRRLPSTQPPRPDESEAE